MEMIKKITNAIKTILIGFIGLCVAGILFTIAYAILKTL